MRRPVCTAARFRLWLDQASAQLRELNVRYTPLHESLGDNRIGGTVEFMMLPTGAWIVRRWQLRIPKLDASALGIATDWGRVELDRTYTIRGFHDVGGELLRVATRDGTTTYPGVVLSGAVVDSTTLRPIADVTVHPDGVKVATRTDSVGWFQLSDLSFGEHALVFLKEGFSPRTFRFEVMGADQGDVDVGLVGLSPGPAPLAEISGTVADVITNEPVVGVVVSINDQTAAVTDIEGTFWIAASLRLGTNRLNLRRIGYRPIDAIVWIARDSSEYDLDIKLEPLAVELEAIVIEGDRMIVDFTARLRDFNRRRRSGLGTYFTRQDVERRRPYYVSDLLARVPSVAVVPTVSGNNIVRMRRFGRLCRPAVYIDGVKLLNLSVVRDDAPAWEMDIDELVMPDEIAGIEVYRGGAQTPVEFGMFGGVECGVIAIWTRQR